MGQSDGKVAFITGAARGQGRSHAMRLASDGFDIIALDICAQIDSVPYALSTREDLAETVRAVEALDRRIVAGEADVRDPASLQTIVDTGVAELGRLDIIVANAGIAPVSSASQIPCGPSRTRSRSTSRACAIQCTRPCPSRSRKA